MLMHFTSGVQNINGRVYHYKVVNFSTLNVQIFSAITDI